MFTYSGKGALVHDGIVRRRSLGHDLTQEKRSRSVRQAFEDKPRTVNNYQRTVAYCHVFLR